MAQSLKKTIEGWMEFLLWKGRLITILAVAFSFLSSLALFIAGSNKIWRAITKTISDPGSDLDFNILLVNIIAAVDLYLIAIVLLIFSFGVYELFISKIDLARDDKEINILEVKTLDDLKTRLFKVIIMAMVVYFFKMILTTKFSTPMEMLILAGAILTASATTYFMRRLD